MILLAAAALGAFALTLLLVPVCRLIAVGTGAVAHPQRDRWNTRPTPLLGGVAIVVATLVTTLFIVPAAPIAPLLIGAVLMFVVGLVDDYRTLRPSTKLAAQIVLASGLVATGARLEWTSSLSADAVLTIVWIVGVTNALNLLDNMDGLCGGIACIAAVSLSLAFVTTGLGMPPLVVSVALAGALAGFLIFNVQPASIFMGDSGSLFCGFLLAALSLELPRVGIHPSNFLAIVGAPLLLLLVPILDTVLVTVARILSGRSPSQGGRDHSSHRLVAIGLPERSAVFVLWTLAAVGAAMAWLVRYMTLEWSLLLAAVYALSMALFAGFLWNVRVYSGQDLQLTRSGRITPLILNFVHKRRVFEVCLDFCLISLAYYAAYRLRFEGRQFSAFFPRFLESLPIVVGVQIAALLAAGVYRGVWRFFSFMDGVVIGKGVVLGTVASVITVVYVFRFEDYSRAVFVIYAALLFIGLAGSRASFRLMGEFVNRRRVGLRTVIYGAGRAGALVARDLLQRDAEATSLVGFVDDDPTIAGSRVHGYPVLGGFDDLSALVQQGKVDRVIVSTRLVAPNQLEALEALCTETGVGFYRMHFDLRIVEPRRAR